MRFHQDDRAVRYCDIFDSMKEGDINISVVYPGTIAAWHRHQHQTDYQIVIKGALKVGLCDKPASEGGAVEWQYLSQRSASQGPLVIPPNIWHGSYNFTKEPAILVYFITQKYDGTDEERATVEEMGFDWAVPIK